MTTKTTWKLWNAYSTKESAIKSANSVVIGKAKVVPYVHPEFKWAVYYK